MSSPNLTSEMAHFLEDNLLQFLMGATEDEIDTFVGTLLPHISPVGVNRVYPVVAESFPPSSFRPVDEDGDEVRLNMRRGNPEREGTE